MRRILIVGAVLTAALALGGCSSAGSSTSSGSADVGANAMSAPQAADGSTTSGTTQKAGDLIPREVVTTVNVTIRAKDPIGAADSAARMAETLGGRVDDRNETAATKTAPAAASLTLRVPATEVTTALDRVKSLGKQVHVSQSADDVTSQGQDLDARIKALSTSVDRLLALEARATNSATLIQFETDISDRQGQLDSLVAQRKTLSDQVAMSTIALRLVAPAAIARHKSSTPVSAAGAGFAGFAAFFTGVFLVLSFLLPWLLLIVGVGAVVFFVRRRRRRSLTA